MHPISIFIVFAFRCLREQHKSLIMCHQIVYFSTQVGVNKQMRAKVRQRRLHDVLTAHTLGDQLRGLQPGTEVSSMPFVVPDL